MKTIVGLVIELAVPPLRAVLKFSSSTLTEAQVTLWEEDSLVRLSALPKFDDYLLVIAHWINLETILPMAHELNPC